jgi:transposase
VDDTVSCGLTRARGRRTHKAEPQRREKGLGHSLEEALGRSRGGFSTKVHVACYGKGRPLSVVLTPGQRHASTQLRSVLDGLRVPLPSGIGMPRKRPDHLIADKGYDFPSRSELLRKRGIAHTSSERRARRERRARHPSRLRNFDASVYGRRNVVERCVNRLKHGRGSPLPTGSGLSTTQLWL